MALQVQSQPTQGGDVLTGNISVPQRITPPASSAPSGATPGFTSSGSVNNGPTPGFKPLSNTPQGATPGFKPLQTSTPLASTTPNSTTLFNDPRSVLTELYSQKSNPVGNFLQNPQNGILPYEKINNVLSPYDIGNEKLGVKGLAKTVANQGLSLGRLAVGVASSADPIANAKKIVQGIGGEIGLGKDLVSQYQSEKNLSNQIPALEAAIEKNKQMGKDTSNLESALQMARENAHPNGILDETAKNLVVHDIPTAVYKSFTPSAVQEGVTTGKEKGVGAGFEKALQSIAEDPQQLAPYILMAKPYIEKNLPAVDKSISTTGQAVLKPAEIPLVKSYALGKALAAYGTGQLTGLSFMLSASIIDVSLSL